jgi:hypothetical protein
MGSSVVAGATMKTLIWIWILVMLALAAVLGWRDAESLLACMAGGWAWISLD